MASSHTQRGTGATQSADLYQSYPPRRPQGAARRGSADDARSANNRPLYRASILDKPAGQMSRKRKVKAARQAILDPSNQDPSTLDVLERAINDGTINAYYLHDFSKCRTQYCPASQLQIKKNGYCVDCSVRKSYPL